MESETEHVTWRQEMMWELELVVVLVEQSVEVLAFV